MNNEIDYREKYNETYWALDDCARENIVLKNKLDLNERKYAILNDVDFLQKLYAVGVAQEAEIQTITKSRDEFVKSAEYLQMKVDQLEWENKVVLKNRDELAKKVDDLENKVDQLEWENKGIDEWREEYLAVRQHYDKLMLAANMALKTLYGYEASIRKFNLLFGNGQLAIDALKDAGAVNE